MQTRNLLLISFLVVFVVGAPCWADTVDYNITGQFGSGFSSPGDSQVAADAPFKITFTLPSAPAPLAGDIGPDCFSLAPVDLIYTFGGNDFEVTGRLEFYDVNLDGGVDLTFFIDSYRYFFELSSHPDANILYGGTAFSPAMLGGKFLMNDNFFELASLDANGNPVQVTTDQDTFAEVNAVTAVPEPASVALFGSGLLSMAGALRRRMK